MIINRLKRLIAFNRIGFPIQAQLLSGQVLDQQAAQLLFIQIVELRQQVVVGGDGHATILRSSGADGESGFQAVQPFDEVALNLVFGAKVGELLPVLLGLAVLEA